MRSVKIVVPWIMAFAYANLIGSESSIQLIVRADDIGSSHAANIACIKSYTEGIARSVEVMVPCSWFPEAVKLLNEHPEYDVGIHLVLTSEWENVKWRPLTNATSLTDEDGYFYPFIWKSQDHPDIPALREADWKLSEIENEMRAQIELALRKIPHISHLSYHMGCNNWSPEVQKLMENLAEEYDLNIDPKQHGVKSAGRFGNAKTLEERITRFIEILDNLESGKYIFIDHPGWDTPEMQGHGHKGYYGVAADRMAVTQILTHPLIKAHIKANGIQLISYKDLEVID